MSEATVPRVLVIDDDVMFLEIARFNLERVGIDVEVASDPEAGFNRAIEADFQLILLDLRMPGLDGEEVLRLMKPLGRQQRILVVSGERREKYQARARDLGAIGYIQKPVDARTLCGTVRDLLDEHSGEEADESGQDGSASVVSSLTAWVFGPGRATFFQQVAAVGVLVGLLGVFLWLLFGQAL